MCKTQFGMVFTYFCCSSLPECLEDVLAFQFANTLTFNLDQFIIHGKTKTEKIISSPIFPIQNHLSHLLYCWNSFKASYLINIVLKWNEIASIDRKARGESRVSWKCDIWLYKSVSLRNTDSCCQRDSTFRSPLASHQPWLDHQSSFAINSN
jgi:hypothetical protein